MTAQLSACALLGLPMQYAHAAPPIKKLRGSVNRKTVYQFFDFVADHLDKIIGLDVGFEIDSTNKAGRLVIDKDSDGLNVYLDGSYNSDSDKDDYEIVVNGPYNLLHGSYVVDGYYIVKSGGMHQGILSYGLTPVDESQVLLSGAKITPLRIR